MGDIYDIRIVGQSPDDPAQIRVELNKVEPDPPQPEPPTATKRFGVSDRDILFTNGYTDFCEMDDGSFLVLLAKDNDTVHIERKVTETDRKGQNGWQHFSRNVPFETRMQSYDPANYGNRPEYYFEPPTTIEIVDGDSIVFAECHDAPGARPQLDVVIPVVFVTNRQDFDHYRETGLRPPYVGVMPNLSELLAMPEAVFDVLPETPDPDEFFRGSHGPNVYHDHISGWLGRYSHPSMDMPDYGREIAAQLGDLMCLVMTKFDDAVRQRLWRRFRQIALDLSAAYDRGTRWGADGGHGNGRLLPVLTVLPLAASEHRNFSEAAQTFYDTDLNRYEWSIRPNKEDPSWTAAYRQCCTFCAMSNHMLAILYWPALRKRLLHGPLLGYGRLYANKDDSEFLNPRFHFWTDFARALWKKYGK